VILDPPSYGHGPHGEAWRLAEDLPRLLALCAELTERRPRFVLLTCHTPGFSPARLLELLSSAFGSQNASAAPLVLLAFTGQVLPSGVAARWAGETSDPGGVQAISPGSRSETQGT
jgi:23S rRNA (cytosine1962-C5)-methyltransferase